jgi:hypothetical protein
VVAVICVVMVVPCSLVCKIVQKMVTVRYVTLCFVMLCYVSSVLCYDDDVRPWLAARIPRRKVLLILKVYVTLRYVMICENMLC